MLLWGAVALLGATLILLSAIIVLDVRGKGWNIWLDTLHGWQGTIGTVAGFLSAAGALMISTAIQTEAEISRSERASYAIGQALAYEVESMIGPLQTTYYIAQNIDMQGEDLAGECNTLVQGMRESMLAETPVYRAILGQVLDFGDFNLSIFARFYSYYGDLRREVLRDQAALCDAYPEDRIGYFMRIISGGFQYYQIIATAYPNVTPLQPGMLPEPTATETP